MDYIVTRHGPELLDLLRQLSSGPCEPAQRERVSLLFDLILSNPEDLEESRWDCIQALLFAFSLPLAQRELFLIRLVKTQLRESYMSVMEVWDDWLLSVKDKNDTSLAFAGLGALAREAGNQLPAKRALDILCGVYCAIHNLRIICRPASSAAASQSHNLDAMDVEIRQHDVEEENRVFSSWEEIVKVSGGLGWMRSTLCDVGTAICASEKVTSGVTETTKSTLTALSLIWLDLLFCEVGYSEGLAENSLEISTAEINAIFEASLPILELLASLGAVTNLFFPFASDLDWVNQAFVPLGRRRIQASDVAARSISCFCGLSVLWFLLHSPESRSNLPALLQGALVYSPFWESVRSAFYAQALVKCAPKWGLLLTRVVLTRAAQADPTQSTQQWAVKSLPSQISFSARANSALQVELQPAGALLARLWETLVDVAVKTPSAVTRTRLMQLFLVPLLQLPTLLPKSRFTLLQSLLSRSPYTNASVLLINLIKQEFNRAYASNATNDVFLSKSLFDTLLPHLLHPAQVASKRETVSAALNLLRFAAIRDAKQRKLSIWSPAGGNQPSEAVSALLRLRQSLTRGTDGELRTAGDANALKQNLNQLADKGMPLISEAQAEKAQTVNIAQQQVLLSVCERVIELLDVSPSISVS